MLPFLGSAAVVAAMAGALILAATAARAARSPDSASRFLPRVPVRIIVGGAVAAMAILEIAILTNDFTVSYVADNHSRTTPFPFNVASAWAALEGSIVLWGLVLAVFVGVVFRDHRRRPDRLGAGALAVMGLVAVFFFGMMATVANPFETCVEAGPRSCLASSPNPFVDAVAPTDGRGPNPLLQNHILMAVHPPLLYIGYVGLTVPFAYAISALAIAMPGVEWLRRSKRSTLVAWVFLTLGIVLGGWWAYEVLSWGGYWAWDPVENASFMPWLVATAFIHSALVQERRRMLQSWNFVLVIAAFSLTILGTFLTRSGTIASVHSFTQSAVGPVLLGFLAVVLVGSFSLFALRAPVVAQASRMDSLVSREGSFLVNNLLLTVYAFVVLVGTLYPLVLEAFTGTTVGLGRPFYNQLAVPLSFALLLAMGVGPVMPWRHAPLEDVERSVHGPMQVALAAGVIVVVTTSTIGWVVLATVLSTFVVAVIIRHLLVSARGRRRAPGWSLGREMVGMVRRDPGYWGGQLSHVGVAVLALGIALASNLSSHTRVEMVPGDTVRFDGYEITYRSPFARTEPNRSIEGATMVVTRSGETVTELAPRFNTFPGSAMTIGTPAVHSAWRGDLYLTLRVLDSSGVTLDLDSSPFQGLVWAGGLLTAAGGGIALGRRRRLPVAVEETADA